MIVQRQSLRPIGLISIHSKAIIVESTAVEIVGDFAGIRDVQEYIFRLWPKSICGSGGFRRHVWVSKPVEAAGEAGTSQPLGPSFLATRGFVGFPTISHNLRAKTG